MTEDILFDNVRFSLFSYPLASCLISPSQQIYIGHSESDASALAAETFLIKKPLEDALEEADKPITPPVDEVSAPDYKIDPLGFAQFKLQKFFDAAVLDPVGAFTKDPATGAAAGILFANVLGLLTVGALSSLRRSSLSQTLTFLLATQSSPSSFPPRRLSNKLKLLSPRRLMLLRLMLRRRLKKSRLLWLSRKCRR